MAATNRWGRGPSGGAHGAGFNELFHPPLVPPLNRRFHRRFSSGARPLAPRSIRVHVRFRAASFFLKNLETHLLLKILKIVKRRVWKIIKRAVR